MELPCDEKMNVDGRAQHEEAIPKVTLNNATNLIRYIANIKLNASFEVIQKPILYLHSVFVPVRDVKHRNPRVIIKLMPLRFIRKYSLKNATTAAIFTDIGAPSRCADRLVLNRRRVGVCKHNGV